MAQPLYRVRKVIGAALYGVGGYAQFLYAPVLIAARAAENFFDGIARGLRQQAGAIFVPAAAKFPVDLAALGVEAEGDIRPYFLREAGEGEALTLGEGLIAYAVLRTARAGVEPARTPIRIEIDVQVDAAGVGLPHGQKGLAEYGAVGVGKGDYPPALLGRFFYVPERETGGYPLAAVNGVHGDILSAEETADVHCGYGPAFEGVAYYALAALIVFVKFQYLVIYHGILYSSAYL